MSDGLGARGPETTASLGGGVDEETAFEVMHALRERER